ncbi:MAG: hypothetical protein K9K67_16285 [Bacteriovoracaceae bacterium]|nr:hypothetical protein [Bacteriovoracaceae bacterium]
MYFEYIIPDLLREHKFLYLIVFGLYLSAASWTLIFLRDQAFCLIRSVVDTLISCVGELFLKTFDLLAHLIQSPFYLIEYFISRKGKDFKRRKELLQIWAQTCTVDELREHIFGKLQSVNGPQELSELEASIKPFWDNFLYTYGTLDPEEELAEVENDHSDPLLIDQTVEHACLSGELKEAS